MPSRRHTVALTALLAGSKALTLPGTVTTSCASFLSTLDGNSAIQSCLSPALDAVASFDPTNSTASQNTIDGTLSTLCQSSSCPVATWSQTLSSFATDCSTELATGGNVAVQNLYDMVYLIYPFTEAVCATNPSTGQKCLLDITSSSQDGTANATVANAQVGSVIANATSDPTAVFNIQTFVQGVIDSSDSLFSSLIQVHTKRAISRLLRRQVTGASSSALPSATSVSVAPVASGLTSASLSLSASASTSAYPSAASISGSAAAAAASAAVSGIASGSSIAGGVTNSTSPGSISVPDSSTWTQSGLAYLFLNGQMPSSLLCSACAKTILATYISYFNQVPYAQGIANSPTLSGMTSLWTSVGKICGSTTLQQINIQAGTPNSSTATSAASRLASSFGAFSIMSLFAFYIL